MKKTLIFAIVLIVATGISLGFRHAMSGSSEASQRETGEVRLDRADFADRLRDPVEGAALVPAGSADEKSDREFARVAATAGDRLLDRARQSPDNPHLLRQAAAHYRAALAHEPTVRDAGDLFAGVRDKLAAIERMSRPGVAKPTPKTPLPPAIVKAPAPVARPETPALIVPPAVPATPELIMFGPDGAEIRRVAPIK